MSLHSRLWKLSSLLSFAAGALLLCAIACAQSSPPTSVLLLPVRSHWLSQPLSDSVTTNLIRELTASGFHIVAAAPETPAVQLAISEGWIEREDLEADRLDSARHALAVAAGAAASLRAVLAAHESQVSLSVSLAGTVARREVTFEVSAPAAAGRDSLARELARRVAAALREEQWREAGADERGARLGAAERSAAGQLALAQGMYREAVLEFEAALLAVPDSPDYLAAAAEARMAQGDYTAALVRLRRLAGLSPEEADVFLTLGEVSLAAREFERAEAAFLQAEALSPEDQRAIEGAARAARARRDYARSESHYQRLLLLLNLGGAHWKIPQQAAGRIDSGRSLAGQCQSFPGKLARWSDDSIRLSPAGPETLRLQLARLCLRTGDIPAGVAALAIYHHALPRPAYTDVEYLDVSPALDEHSEAIARGAQITLAARALDDISVEDADSQMDRLHDESDRLATLADSITAPPRLDPAHRYRVLAYNLLNESNFEALMFLRTADQDRDRRAGLLRSAFREARSRATELGRALLKADIPLGAHAPPGAAEVTSE